MFEPYWFGQQAIIESNICQLKVGPPIKNWHLLLLSMFWDQNLAKLMGELKPDTYLLLAPVSSRSFMIGPSSIVFLGTFFGWKQKVRIHKFGKKPLMLQSYICNEIFQFATESLTA